VQTISRKDPKYISQSDANYLLGFVDGEGSFNISFKIRNDYRHKVQVYPSFNISQKEKNILVWIQNLLGCGTIRNRGDGVYYYEVNKLSDLQEIIIPFFKIYKLKTKKILAFEIFTKILKLLSRKLEWSDIQNIYYLREKIVVGRKRKYSLIELERFWKSSETIRQT
jgi:hypothetical protein